MFGTSAFAATPFAALAGGRSFDSAIDEAVTASDTAVSAVALFAPLILEEIAVGINIAVAASDFSAAIAETISALDTPSALVVFPAYFEDTTTAADTVASLATFEAAYADTASVSDLY